MKLSLDYIPSNQWQAYIEMEMGGIAAEKRFAILSGLVRTSLWFTDPMGKSILAVPGGNVGGAGYGTKDTLVRINTSFLTKELGKSTPPKLIEVLIPTDVWIRSYTFELQDVPFPK